MGLSYLIVISILEGRNFPSRQDKLLVVEAKFDGEVMSTDPVAHVTLPDFNTELAWEVDKKGLQMHRLQRTPVKLLWYAVDMELSRKEAIGYMILDIRLAQEKNQVPKWLPLLNSKYQKEKPEVLLSLFLEKEVIQTEPVIENGSVGGSRTSAANEERSRKKPPNSSVRRSESLISQPSLPSSTNDLKPVLISDAGYYQIGPPDMCKDNFTFSVTLAFAANLNKLMPPEMSLRTKRFYYFYYSLFENDVTTEKFMNLSNPDFPAERASVRISSSIELLSAFFEHNPSLEILLCCGDITLGSGHIPLGPLSSINKHKIDEEPLCIEGSVQITQMGKKNKSSDEDLSPFVGVSVVLQKENTIEMLIPNDAKNSIDRTIPMQSTEGTQSLGQFQQSVPQKLGNDKKGKEEKEIKEPHKEVSHQNEQISTVAEGQTLLNTAIKNLNGHPVSEPPLVIHTPHHYCFTLDMCTFRTTRMTHPINLFIRWLCQQPELLNVMQNHMQIHMKALKNLYIQERYSYPFFGSTTSIVTHPEVEAHPKIEVSIPHGYCAFNFATVLSLLKTTFWETPLLLEVFHRKTQGNCQDQLIGTSRINLFQVLEAAPSPHIADPKKQGTRRMTSCKTSVVSSEGHEVAEIFSVLTLDDLGPTTVLCDKQSTKNNICNMPQNHGSAHNALSVPVSRQNGLTQEELLQAAMELEMWQERQRMLFRTQLKDKEMQHLKVLISEWKQRDAERELLLQRKLQECQKLEDKLKLALAEAEIKEKQLAAQETELLHKLHNIEKQQEEQQQETKKHIENIKVEYNELLRIERLNIQELEQKKNSLQRQVIDQEADLFEKKNIIESLQTQLSKQPDIQMKTEINILNMEKAELQQKLETTTASKQKYKSQWGQAMRQISLLQQKLHAMEKVELSKKDEELAALHQRILVAEEHNALRKDQETLLKVKDRVDTLRAALSHENENSPRRQQSEFPSAESGAKAGPSINGNSEQRGPSLHVQQLIAQRDKLLGTGMYTEEDRIIQQLNVHIQKARCSSA